MGNGDVERKYHIYISRYIEDELKDNFKRSIDDSDNNILCEYSNQVLERLCTCIAGLNNNQNFKDYLFNEVLLASQIGFTLNSATKRFSLESLENNSFIEHKKTKKNKISIKEKVIIFLLELLDKNNNFIK